MRQVKNVAKVAAVVVVMAALCGTVQAADCTWQAMDSNTTKGLCGVWGSSSTNVFAVGTDGAILHYADHPDPTATPTSTPTDTPTITDTPTDTPTPTSTVVCGDCGSMSGQITFNGRTDHWDVAEIKLKNTTTDELLNYKVETDSLGDYSISEVPLATYHVLCYSPPYLKRLVTPITVTSGGVEDVDFLGLGLGDFNDDNVVEFADLSGFSVAYGTSGDEMP